LIGAAAIGFRSRTGRATAIVLSGSSRSPESEAIVAIQPLVDRIEEIARDVVQQIADDLRSRGIRIRAAGVVGSPPRDLEKIGNFPHQSARGGRNALPARARAGGRSEERFAATAALLALDD
jgi:hypothetical protein